VLEIYRRGQQLGNSPSAFSKVGDCEATPSWFLGAFDGNPGEYSLGSYGDLQAVIAQFHGSYGRTSLAAGRGFTAANVLAPLWADHTQCEANETPLACEVRVNRPSFAFVMLGTNDVYHQETFDANMRLILDALIQDGVVPILATKADNLEAITPSTWRSPAWHSIMTSRCGTSGLRSSRSRTTACRRTVPT
jgi:hypothetical protein